MADSVNIIKESKDVAERVETLLADIRNLILTARKAAVRSVDILQVMTCFEIGRRIVEHEQQGSVRAKYGKRVLGELSERLVAEFGKGFSKSNLEYMRRFYLMYRDRSPSITQTASGQLGAGEKTQTSSGESDVMPAVQGILIPGKRPFLSGWSIYVFLMGIGNPEERAFYEFECKKSTTRWWRSPCPRMPISTPGNISFTCRQRRI